MIPKTFVAVLFFGWTLTAAGATDLTVTIKGVQNDRGYIISTVYNSESSFLKRPEAFASMRIKALGGEVSFSLRNLPPGKYAVGAFHDANDNGKLDVEPSGQPTEVYGFSSSNNTRVTSGPPGFADAAFELTDQIKLISIDLGL
jgi:uncharacterized protein (DUF2141 family)